MARSSDLVQQLWGLCNVLRDDGITYHQYVNELTYLLFLKMAQETGAEEALPEDLRWGKLAQLTGSRQFDFYRTQLVTLGTQGNSRVRAIFANPTSLLRHSESLNILVRKIDELDWYRAKQEGLGDLYEGLLQKNASEKKSGAGQYFTARPLIDSMVSVMKPGVDDSIQDPAAGTGGFLVAFDSYIRENANPTSWTEEQQRRYRASTFFGMEHVQDTHRLALMNLMLHGIAPDSENGGVQFGDTLGPDGQALPDVSLILTNPPFGTKSGGGLPTRTDLPFPTSNKQFSFLQHIYLKLQRGGRAAVVLPDNVLFEGSIGKQIRRDLMEKCNLHTILRLPTRIFYAQGVKTNVLFFTRGHTDSANTEEVWVYDLRANMRAFNKRAPLTRSYFQEFEKAFGDDPRGGAEARARRSDSGADGRFRCFSRDWITERGDNLDIAWLKDSSRRESDESLDPAIFAVEALEHLEAAVDEVRGLLMELGEEIEL
jgi:type I restriction enzyme M protein